MKRKNIVVLLLLLSILGLCFFLLYQNYWGENKPSLQATGTIEATSVEVKARVSGTIKSFKTQAGDPVKAGQLVAELSRHDLLARKKGMPWEYWRHRHGWMTWYLEPVLRK